MKRRGIPDPSSVAMAGYASNRLASADANSCAPGGALGISISLGGESDGDPLRLRRRLFFFLDLCFFLSFFFLCFLSFFFRSLRCRFFEECLRRSSLLEDAEDEDDERDDESLARLSWLRLRSRRCLPSRCPLGDRSRDRCRLLPLLLFRWPSRWSSSPRGLALLLRLRFLPSRSRWWRRSRSMISFTLCGPLWRRVRCPEGWPLERGTHVDGRSEGTGGAGAR
mmetsp:Transcript_30201/g.63687  ORF Transcript_30201/g.63687 Transcript_30201/m.63687 type:complete len:224 (+) Transcript_30201:1892-2563(+)